MTLPEIFVAALFAIGWALIYLDCHLTDKRREREEQEIEQAAHQAYLNAQQGRAKTDFYA